MLPILIKGKLHSDVRGSLFYNNDFDLTSVKRIYYLENSSNEILRGWQGHKIEQRWFSVVQGRFLIKLIKIDNWEQCIMGGTITEFIVTSKTLDVLHVPKGYVSCIQSIEDGSKLLAMSDYRLGEIEDEYRFEIDYFDTML